MSQPVLLALVVALVASGALVAVALIRRRLHTKTAEIEEMNRRFQATFEQAAVGVAHLDRQGRWIRINARFCELSGYSRDELMAMTVDDLTHPLDREQDNAARAGMMAGDVDKNVVEKRYLRKDGEIIWVNATRSTIRDAEGRPEFFVAVVEEITARKEAEASLAAGGAQYRAIFDQTAVGIAYLTPEGRWFRVNERFCEISGYEHDELLQMSFQQITHPDDLPMDTASRERLLAGDVSHVLIEKRYLRKDGSVVWVNATRSLFRDDEGQPEFFLSVVEDISLRKLAEEELISGEARYRAIFDSAVEAMAVIDSKGTIQSINPSVERTFGYAERELMGKNIKLLMPRAIAVHHDGYLGRYNDTGEKAIIGIGREVIGRRKDGSQFPLDLSVAEWERDGVTFFTGVMRDVSARKDAEAALRRSEESLRGLQNEFAHLARVNDLGEMAAAIAHEINQPLTAIVNYLNTGLFMAGEGSLVSGAEETEQLIRQAFEQALRAGDIVRRLREFIGQGTGVRRPEPVERLVDSAIALALIDARSNGVEVHRVSEAGDAEVEVDAVQIQQVLANLMRNGVDAMLGARRSGVVPMLTVSATLGSDDMVEIAVTDNGPGISSEIGDRLFDPFVTTKSNGMGMGLSVCRRLIEAHGGTIDAESVPGQGASFSFRLPLFRPVLH